MTPRLYNGRVTTGDSPPIVVRVVGGLPEVSAADTLRSDVHRLGAADRVAARDQGREASGHSARI